MADELRPTAKPTVGFQDRYANDVEFKRQVDEGRKRSNQGKSLEALKASLNMVKDGKKLY